MQRMSGLWLAVAALGACVGGTAAQNMRLPMEFLSTLGNIRPAKSVLRAVRAVAPDLFVDPEQRVRAWGYPFETHTVRTEDGYLLTLHRIPRGRPDGAAPEDKESNSLDNSGPSSRPPIVLQHGMMSCSEVWVLGGPRMGQALRLADSGYDVWMANARGNHFSSKHETMGQHDPQFWMFSWHEMGVYDIPAYIDYILNHTKQEKLFFAGHSMGTTSFAIAMSLRPEYNAKIRLHIALSPSIFFDDATSAPFELAVTNIDYLKGVLAALPSYEFAIRTDAMIAMVYLLCGEKAYLNKMCAMLFSWTVGALDLKNTTHLGLLLSRSGSASSVLVPLHFVQVINSGEFRQLDRGISENMRVYGTPRPPEYQLDKVTAPMAIYGAEHDIIVTPKAIERLTKILPNVVSIKIVHEKFFNHMDFIYHPRLNELITDHMLETMARF